ncbi:all trans-polyprenyl-diphosphate synthase PDSS1-like [Mytilus trossulus]|uniref:all trans-polyprenyl-diphosphate synthase PDSS1-like n=1 Tax=Mytilus trossulus TaxID=6551 RepID=UPI00300533AA
MATPGRSRLQTEILNLYRQRHILKRQLSTLRTQITKYPNNLERTRIDSCHLCMKPLTCSQTVPLRCSSAVIANHKTNPFSLVETEVSTLCDKIKQKFVSEKDELKDIADYYFDGKGKFFRPMVALLMAKAVNFHNTSEDSIWSSQEEIAMIAEIIHTASLIHDDVIDGSNTRRGKPTVDSVWGQKKAILAGDYLLSVSSVALARLGNTEVVAVLSQVIEDLVRGEFMQMGSKENENDRFNHYLKKTFKKTASLLANSCKAVSILGNSNEDITDVAFEYGKNVGIAFQLIDDLLDFTSCEEVMGKPTAADLRLGLATAPVLFAAQDYPELNPMIMRRFNEEGDIEWARKLVAKSDGVTQTRMLAEEHSKEAIRQIRTLKQSIPRDSLEQLAVILLQRQK